MNFKLVRELFKVKMKMGNVEKRCNGVKGTTKSIFHESALEWILVFSLMILASEVGLN